MLIYGMQVRFILAAFTVCLGLRGQDTLTLRDAVNQALTRHPAVEAANARVAAAANRVAAAKSGWFPKLDYTESYRRSDNPVFVFGSLLTQHQFTAANFALSSLNRPDSLNNFQSQVGVEQTIFDGQRTRLAINAAESMKSAADSDKRVTEMDRIGFVVRAYYGAALAKDSLRTAQESVRAAEADLQKARNVRAAGMSTDADVLAIQVHLAAMREQEIRRRYDLDVATAALNEAIGAPLSTLRTVAGEFDTVPAASELEAYAKPAANHPYLAIARSMADAAEAQSKQARAALFPQVSAFGMFEADRQNFLTKGGANWTAGVSMRWNLFSGYADRARIAETAAALKAAQAGVKQRTAEVELVVRRAYADWKSSGERVTVASSTVEMAEESLRITRNRFEAGLASVTDLLAKETALLEAKTRLLAARYDQKLSAVGLEHAAGTLSENSDVLK